VSTAVWTGTLSFGLVTIPVKLYPATQPKDVRFHLVDRATGQRIRYRRVVGPDNSEMPADQHVGRSRPAVREDTGTSAGDTQAETWDAVEEEPSPIAREVAYDDLIRGYEVEPGEFVTLEPEEIEAVRPSRSRTIDVEEFVPLDRIDPVFFEKSYYLAPQAGAERPYVLLLRAMMRADLVGIGRFVLRTKPHLVAIRPTDPVLALETLYFADEVRPSTAVAPRLEETETSERELALAEQLIATLARDWEPSRYSDEYRDELLRLISERTPTRIEQTAASAPTGHPGVLELMDALKASVEAAKRDAATGTDGSPAAESGS
jgi:DNA end-binding protein Ku